jgi:aldose 1-epimerase
LERFKKDRIPVYKMKLKNLSRNISAFLLLALLVVSCSPKPGKEQVNASSSGNATEAAGKGGIQKELFGQTADGTEVHLFTLTNQNGLQARITNYGCFVTSLLTPDRDGHMGDVVLGFDSLNHYFNRRFFGSVVGRFSNRIANARFTLDGVTYELAANNGPNHIHGGIQAFDKKVWGAEEMNTADGPALKLSYLSKDGEEGYPGNLQVSVTYTLTQDNGLRIVYEATTDKATPVNLTNHSYFNLGGGQTADVLGHQISLEADEYTVMNEALIPTGEIRSVQGTPLDFRSPAPIGERINQLEKGFDHNFVFRNQSGELSRAGSVYEPLTGRYMEVFTTKPGVQFYVPNWQKGFAGRGGQTYQGHGAFCLETQYFPDSPNQPHFPNTILRPGETYRHTTIYTFSVRAKNS